ncbi:sensor histidine kinase [Streptomyces sp. WMMB 322]|uniref:sensor histidine kinase n=1 Tax=Streptomyces sp. WMMB 322 TaxID=1286821 RepID=UPI0006E3F387|nr:histidine kinase [Streptomyces sp. WMMB 322]SCK38610.1 two-component system, NarL family, sensor histidine kinase DesK [Streptomyces sp. WMMB 322]
MIGWWGVAPKYRRWQERSSHEQVEASTRWMLVAYAWLTLVGFVVQLVPEAGPGALPLTLAWTVLALGLVQCLLCTGLLHQAVDSYLGTSSVTGARLAAPAALVGATTALTVALVAIGAVEGGLNVGLGLHGTLAPFAVTFGVAVPRRTAALALCGYLAAVAAALAAAGLPGAGVLAALTVGGLGGILSVFTGRSSAWYIAVIRELEEARGVQARLAVAEERLRFSRDLHDVMGRNLSAIALKSELAAQLAQRGSDARASVEQMTEVQRIARESQSEVRAVVRGYREADLSTELAGARGILRAAGVDCRTDNGGSLIPGPVQAALGWVVREGATNVLRHADATWCTVWVGTDPAGGSALLVMENDGTRGRPPGGRAGSGLAGLRERLDGVGGTLRVAGDGERGTFRLTAEVPLAAGNGTDGEDGAGDAAWDGADGGSGTGGRDGPGGDGTADRDGARAGTVTGPAGPDRAGSTGTCGTGNGTHGTGTGPGTGTYGKDMAE